MLKGWHSNAPAERPRDAAFCRRLCPTLGLPGELDDARSLASWLMTEFSGQRLARLVSQLQPEPRAKVRRQADRVGTPQERLHNLRSLVGLD
jgi:hypothetical protein